MKSSNITQQSPLKEENMASKTLEPVLKVAEVAQHLNCDRNTVYALINDNKLRTIRLGRVIRVPESSLADFIAGSATAR